MNNPNLNSIYSGSTPRVSLMLLPYYNAPTAKVQNVQAIPLTGYGTFNTLAVKSPAETVSASGQLGVESFGIGPPSLTASVRYPYQNSHCSLNGVC
jgi:hypothetical protein